jgi:hypothetical protein
MPSRYGLKDMMDFIRWRRAKGYEVTPSKREFWGEKAWQKDKNQPGAAPSPAGLVSGPRSSQ